MGYFEDYEMDKMDYFDIVTGDFSDLEVLDQTERRNTMNELTNVTTGEVRLSYVHLFKPYAFQPGQEEKFSCTILIPK